MDVLVPSGPELDIAIVGAGIVGLATARAVLQRRPGTAVAVIDKEAGPAQHQSGHNSGVLHSGVYYRPGSAKATLCISGKAELEDYCRARAIPVAHRGKVIVATRTDELGRLEELARRAAANGIDAELVGPSGLRSIEPHVRGVAALAVPSTGVVDFGAVCRSLTDDLRAEGVAFRFGFQVSAVAPGGGGARVHSTTGAAITARVLVNCSGLQADRLAALAGDSPTTRIIPFRGEYRRIVGAGADLVRSLVYPVPDPALPFLGVHLSRGIADEVHLGPNAVLALAREAYRWRHLDPAELLDLLRSARLRHLAQRWWRTGAEEVARSASRHLMLASARRLVPDLGLADLGSRSAGVRAQAVGPHGELLDDFVFSQRAERMGGTVISVLNAPSPAATASLAIGHHIATRAVDALDHRRGA